MMQSPFFPQTTGLTPATEAASLPGGVQSQLGVQTLLTQRTGDTTAEVGVNNREGRWSEERSHGQDKDWRKNGVFHRGLGKNWWCQVDKTGRAGDVEKQTYENEAKGYADRDGNCGGDKVRGGEAQEQRVFDQKEIGSMEADTGLPEIERCLDKDALQMRQRKDSRACAEKKRLRSLSGFTTGLLSASGVQRPKTIFGFQSFWKRLHIQRNAVWFRRRPKNFHARDEEGDFRNQETMGCSGNCIFGRFPYITREQGILSTGRQRDYQVSGGIRSFGEPGEKPVDTKKKVFFPWLRVGLVEDEGSACKRQKRSTYSLVSQMGKGLCKSKNCESERSGFVYWKTQCCSVCSARRFSMASLHASYAPERNKGKRMERQIEVECFNPAADSAMDIEVESTPKTQAYPSIFPGCNSYNRCIGDGLGSFAPLEQPAPRCAQSVPPQSEKAIIQFQGTYCSISCSEPLRTNPTGTSRVLSSPKIGQYIRGVQHKQMECREEASTSAEKIMETKTRPRHRVESVTCSRCTEHKSRCVITTGESRRLRGAGRRMGKDNDETKQCSNAGRVCSATQSQSGKMVRSRKSARRRRTDVSLEERSRVSSSTDPACDSDDPESTTGESTSDITPAELEGTELGELVKVQSPFGMDLEESEGGYVEGSIDATDRCESSTRSIEDNLAECTFRDGEQWWKNALEQKSIPFSLAEECRAGISRSTWRGYLYGFAHFGKQWRECGHGRIPESIQEWAACCANVFLSLRNGGMKLTCLQLTRAAVSLYSNIVFSSFLGDIPIIRTLFRSFRRTDKSRKKKTGDIWNPRKVLSFFSGLGPNEGLSFKQLTMKVIVLTMLFSACRFTKLERVNMLESRFEEEGVCNWTQSWIPQTHTWRLLFRSCQN
ncbi:uncharacterized protein MONOS_7071 [Monocercomonoides exilis]|uniref:uncharacterized protein n=1 Tax=Monocercomonoides exilis TaxID=2049356 RepID=UPI00355A0E16|nr:hypothetical protein MONOS_7071 [Monocercomonoides exilis]|eukprot:MONOS_7071.1-p1 / transcript=MONOS_7071.1 / gene=MONOS_7071 / organism=Monocercomonoides_exilis_PA203 / gene_product=unspecified product / transcript_product=unspecified product / location=Mono_scaffold00234:51575-54301(+) / protein_length=886 / sequence_SO=supercontig / SO=protein_coding / is_pseudo=false